MTVRAGLTATRLARIALGVGFVLAAAGFVGFAAMFDLFAPGGRSGVFWAKLAVIAFSAIPAAAIALAVRRTWMLATLGLAAAAAAVLVLTAWHPRKAFVRDLESVRPGMSLEDVDRILGRYERGPGAKWHPPGAALPLDAEDRELRSGTRIYRWNTTDGAYDSDWGRVEFESGRVTKVEFLPD